MHKESFEIMNYFVEKYLDKNATLEILDVGSYDVNGNYSSLFQNNNWNYVGMDMVDGPNVDIVSNGPYDFGINKKFDVVISGNCLEHVEAPWKWIKEVEKVVKTGGLLCIITPFSIGEHKFPVDCWRILPDGYKYLLEKESSFKLVESKINIPDPETKLINISSKVRTKNFIKFLPKRLQSLFIESKYSTQDTYAIAKKI